MKPAAFDYSAPRTTEEVLHELERADADAKVLAGGQSLVPLMNFRFAQIGLLVDLNRVEELDYVRRTETELRVGALARAREVELSRITEMCVPLIPKALKFVAHVQIRNRGTVCGSIAHADPSAEIPTVATALRATMVLQSATGERLVPAHEFFVTHLTTCMEPNELLVEVRFPICVGRQGAAFTEYARRHGDFAIVGVAATVSLAEDGRCEDARVVLAGVGDRPFDASELVSPLIGEQITDSATREVGEWIASAVSPSSDIHAGAAYRRRMAGVLARRALLAATTDAHKRAE